MDSLQTLQDAGLTLPSPAYIFGALIFGLFGLVAWRYGRRHERPVTQWLGVALMFFPYAISSTPMLFVVGAALTGAAWWAAR